MKNDARRFCLLVRGQVQGVGFRPWVFRTASRWPLTGLVRNDSTGVYIEAQGPASDVEAFISALRGHEDAPPLAQITAIDVSTTAAIMGEHSFLIEPSGNSGTAVAAVTPDAAACEHCLAEMRSASDRRYRYPFINCTNCGPRYTIVKNIPYDRPNTTMAWFEMCSRCAGEYRDASDRRFHAQPVACPACGPHIWLTDAGGKHIRHGSGDVVHTAAGLLMEGRIAAIKGIGGFHLAVDARNDEAVRLLRVRKQRDCKPFAMMAASMDAIGQCAEVSPLARGILRSPQSPIVLLPQKAGSGIAASVAPGTNTFGFMLPYAPLHHLLFDEIVNARQLDVLVMTSANIADQPLIYRNDEAVARLSGIADFFLMHDRDIYRQIDDSVIHFVNDTPVPLRRARGYVPSVVLSGISTSKEILAAGADMKNTFCLARGEQLIVSEHIGDLEDADVYHHYRRSVRHFSGLFDFAPSVVVADLHPGYFSGHFADSLKGAALMQVQHHWAHIASVLAERGTPGPVIGIAADGAGYGTDGAIWGCECLIASLDEFTRFGHLKYFPLAGGDRASKEAIRPLLALLEQSYDGHFTIEDYYWLLQRIEPDGRKLGLILEQLRKGINSVSTSSLGRVFDAVAAMAGLGSYNNFEAQLPIALEAAADCACGETYPFGFSSGAPAELDLSEMFKAIVNDVRKGVPAAIVSARFHNTIAEAFLAMCRKARHTTGLAAVALSGGVFCNRLLAGRTINLLQQNGFDVLYNTVVPANDGGLSLGQAAIAAHRFR